MSVCWNLTCKCNEDCIYCFRELDEKELSVQDNLIIINKLKEAGLTKLTFAGGEPLLYRDLDALLKESKRLGISNSLITNGSLLNSITIDKYLPYVDKLTFSIDSPIEYVNAYSGRGKEHYEHIKMLIPLIHEKYPNIKLEINSVVTKENEKGIETMHQEVSNNLSIYGVTKWKILRFVPLRGHAKLRKDLLDVPEDDFEEIKSTYNNMGVDYDISVRDYEDFYNDIVISPNGSVKKYDQEIGAEMTLIDDLRKMNKEDVVKKLSLGGQQHV